MLAALLCCLAFASPAQSFPDLKPSPQQTEWQDLEFGVILHFSTNTFLNREWGDGTANPNIFNPSHFDPDQWMSAIAASGARYVVLVAKHHDGFCLWPTDQTAYSIKQSPWKQGKGDMVAEVAAAAHRHGLKFGIYLSPWDRHEPKYADSAAYDKFYLAQLEELATRYGDLVEFWLDGAGSAGRTYNFAKIVETLRTYQPNTLVFADTALFEYADIRWAGSETGKIDYENWNVIDRHGYLRWRPVEVDTPLRKLHWFWHPNDEASLKSLDELIDSYENSVGRGGQWMLGVAPDDRGLLPDADVQRLRQLGQALQARYAGNLLHPQAVPDRNTTDRKTPRKNTLGQNTTDQNIANALDGDDATFWSAPPNSTSSTLEVTLTHPITFNTALTMEWLNQGQAIQRYRIEAWQHNAWVALTSGYAIGHEKIDHFTPITTDRVRLHILSSTSAAHIREFQLFQQPTPTP
ncbi:MAG: alpha-L-fucosidase [Acidobacteriota bacterium]|nr:alpha-L-fucosidase [Acidobacteriota bacterium]